MPAHWVYIVVGAAVNTEVFLLCSEQYCTPARPPIVHRMKLHTSFGVASCLVILVAVAYASDHTHIDNHSKKWTIVASTSYPGGHSDFVDRKIAPGGSGAVRYCCVVMGVGTL